jgi:hypothetical protein
MRLSLVRGTSHQVPLQGLELSLWLMSQVFELQLQCNLYCPAQLATLWRSRCRLCGCAHFGTDLTFQAKRSQYVQDTTGLWCLHGRVVVSNGAALCHRNLWEHHDVSWAGHRGVARILELVSRIHWWPTLRRDMNQSVCTCDTCQRFQLSNQAQPGLRQTFNDCLCLKQDRIVSPLTWLQG